MNFTHYIYYDLHYTLVVILKLLELTYNENFSPPFAFPPLYFSALYFFHTRFSNKRETGYRVSRHRTAIHRYRRGEVVIGLGGQEGIVVARRIAPGKNPFWVWDQSPFKRYAFERLINGSIVATISNLLVTGERAWCRRKKKNKKPQARASPPWTRGRNGNELLKCAVS